MTPKDSTVVDEIQVYFEALFDQLTISWLGGLVTSDDSHGLLRWRLIYFYTCNVQRV